MDATTLRIILAVVGALAIAGLYFWERRRNGPDQDDDLFDDADFDEDEREPRLGPWEGDEEDRPSRAAQKEPVQLELPHDPEQPAFDLKPPPEPPAAPPREFPPGPLILTLHIAARRELFDGAALVHAAERCGLEPGEMDIFHCTLGEGDHRQTLFSMANMVKPGTFPFGAMAEFESPGVILFAQLDGTPDDPGRMEEMLGTAHSLAAELGGEVLDEARRPLGREAERRLRERVMAFVGVRLSGAERV
jgi:cell division protein ZipA